MLDKLKSIKAEFRARIHKGLYFNVNSSVTVLKNDTLKMTKRLTVFGIASLQDKYDYTPPKSVHWIIGRGEDITSGYHAFFLKPNDFIAKCNCENGSLYISYPKVINGIFKFAMTYNIKTGLTLYINGNMVNSLPPKGKIVYTTDTDVGIGYLNYRGLYHYIGIISYILVYNTSLSDAEIKYLFNNPFNPPKEDNIVLQLSPASIDMANGKWWDLSGKGNHGTIYNATEVELIKPEVSVR